VSIVLYFIKAWLIGMAIAAPVGPIGMLCIKKTLELGLLGALMVGLGAAMADSCYGLVAALGLSAISHFLLTKAGIIKVIGGFFLIFLAYKEAKGTKTDTSTSTKSTSKLRLATEVFFLTFTNPMTILSFLGIFASISGGPIDALESSIMVIGIFFGSMTWWLILGLVVVKIKHKLPAIWLERIKYLSSFILGGFGMAALIGGLRFF
jgi:putative LysE/RhtB family amino acid efflux pump